MHARYEPRPRDPQHRATTDLRAARRAHGETREGDSADRACELERAPFEPVERIAKRFPCSCIACERGKYGAIDAATNIVSREARRTSVHRTKAERSKDGSRSRNSLGECLC